MDGHNAVAWVNVSHGLLSLLGPQSTSRTVLRRYYTLVDGDEPERHCSLRCSHHLLVGVFFALGLVALVGSFGAHNPLGVAMFHPVGYSEADTVESLSENIQIQSHQFGKCLDWSDQIVMAADCDTSKEKQKWTYVNQMIEVAFGRCLDDGGDAVHVWPCATGRLSGANQHWRFDPPTGLLQDGELLKNNCLQLDMPDSPLVSSVSMQPCDEDNEHQKWTFNAGPLVLTVPPTTTTTQVRAPKTSTASSTAPWTKPRQTTNKTTTVPTVFLPVSVTGTPAATEATTLSETMTPQNTTTAARETTAVATALGSSSSTFEEQTKIASTEAPNRSTDIVTTTGAKGTVLTTKTPSTSAAPESIDSTSAALGSTSTEPRTSAGTAESNGTTESRLPTTEVTIPVLGSTTGEKALPNTTEEQTVTLMPTTTLPSTITSTTCTVVSTITTTLTTITTITTSTATTTTTTTTTATTTTTTTTTTRIRLSAPGNRAWLITKNGGCLLAGNATAYMGPCNGTNGTKESSTWIQTATGLLMSMEEKCLDDSDGNLLLSVCRVENDDQRWSLLGEHNSSNASHDTNITHIQSGKKNCLASDWSNEPESMIRVTLEPCSQGAAQEWKVMPTELPVKELKPKNVLFGFLVTLAFVAFVVLCFGLVVPRCKAGGEHRKTKTKQQKSTLHEPARSLALTEEPPLAPPSGLPPQHMEPDGLQLHPKPRQVLFADPRPNAYKEIGISGFSDRHTQGLYDVLESMCGCGFLSNSFHAVLELDVNGIAMTFTNAEAAFQALRFSSHASDFNNLSGEEAFQLAGDFSGRGFEDPEHGGHGTSWKAMFAVLKAKFKVNTPLGNALEKTEDDFLLCCSCDYDPDAMWSNGATGQGTNWLGMQLMLIRSNRTGWKRWKTFIQSQVDTLTGRPLYNRRDNHFQDAVKRASEALKAVLMYHQATLPSVAQQSATIAGASADAVSGPAEHQRDMMLGMEGLQAGQQHDVLAGYDQFHEPQAGCQACGGTGIDFMGRPCACSEFDFLQQQADLLQHGHEQYPGWEDDAFNGAALNGATPDQDYLQLLREQPRSSGSPAYARNVNHEV